MKKEQYPWNIYPVAGRAAEYPFDADKEAMRRSRTSLPEEAFDDIIKGGGVDFEMNDRLKRLDLFHRLRRRDMTDNFHTMHSDDDYYFSRNQFLGNVLLNNDVYNIPVKNRYDLEDIALFMTHYGFNRISPSGLSIAPKFRISSKSRRCIEVNSDIPTLDKTKKILEKKFNNINVVKSGWKSDWKTRICAVDYDWKYDQELEFPSDW